MSTEAITAKYYNISAAGCHIRITFLSGKMKAEAEARTLKSYWPPIHKALYNVFMPYALCGN